MGSLPAWLSVSHASIERISKKVVREDGRIDGVSEEFIPPILTRRELADTQLVLHTEYFELADDVNRYYYRKLYLNNIGHAVLAYLGSKKGYTTTLEAVADDEIQDVLFAVWDAAGEMVRLKYGFDEQEIDEYFAGRLQCYKNAALADRSPDWRVPPCANWGGMSASSARQSCAMATAFRWRPLHRCCTVRSIISAFKMRKASAWQF